MTEKEEKVPVTIRFTKTVHDALVKYKKLTGMSISSQVYASVSAWLFIKRLLTLDEANGTKKKKEKIKTQPIPEALKFCDGDSCTI